MKTARCHRPATRIYPLTVRAEHLSLVVKRGKRS